MSDEIDNDKTPTQTPTEVVAAPVPVDDGTVTVSAGPKTLAAVALASLSIGAFGGVEFTSPAAPAAEVELYVHVLRLEQSDLQRPPQLTTYSHTVKHLPDGGTKRRDVGAASCADAGIAAQALLTELNARCAPASNGWLHVVELHPDVDGSTAVAAFGSHIANGGVVDDGLVACDGINAVAAFVEAAGCARSGLDE